MMPGRAATFVAGFSMRALPEGVELSLETRDQRVELVDNSANRFGLAEVDARALQQRHRMIAATRFE